MGDTDNSDWKPRFLSEYSMGELDFLRFNEHLKFIEMYSGEINSSAIPTLEQCQKYFAGLNVLYKLWRPIISSKDKLGNLDKNLDEAKKIKRNWERNQNTGIPFNEKLKLKMVDILDEFHSQLMEMKQIIGLGIKVQRNLSTREKIRLGIKGDVQGIKNLPAP